MKIITSALTGMRLFGMRFTTALALFGCCGCTHLATVKTTEPRAPTITAENDQLQAAAGHLAQAEREQPLASLGDDLAAAKLSLSVLEQRPSDSSAQSIYNFSVARAVESVERAKIQPWQRQIDVRGASHTGIGLAIDAGKFSLTSPKPIDSEHDPSRYDLFPVDTLKIGGSC